MRFAFSQDQQDLAAAVGQVLTQHCPPTVVRAAWERGTPPRAAWDRLAAMGLLGALVPEADGGLGLLPVDVVLCWEAAGRSALPAPLAETVVGVPLLAAAGDRGLAAAVLDGSRILTVVLDGSGLAPYVPGSDLALVGSVDGVGLVVDPADSAEPTAAVDHARPLGRLGPGAGTPLDVDPARLAELWDRGVVACAAQQLGSAAAMLDLTVAYVRVREQFGVPVGSFQAVKHRLADAALAVAKARPVVYAAAWALGADAAAAARHVPAAKILATQAARTVAAAALQGHGAIGYTTEHDLHLWLKRAWALAGAWGDERTHRRTLAGCLDLTTSGEATA